MPQRPKTPEIVQPIIPIRRHYRERGMDNGGPRTMWRLNAVIFIVWVILTESLGRLLDGGVQNVTISIISTLTTAAMMFVAFYFRTLIFAVVQLFVIFVAWTLLSVAIDLSLSLL